MTKLFNHLCEQLCRSCLMLILFFSTTAEAKNWQLMMLPNSELMLSQNKSGLSENEPLVSAALASKEMAQFEDGLSLPLSRNLDSVISYQKVFKNCQQKWCGQPSLEEALQQIRTQAENVQLVILYEFNETPNGEITASIKLMDPLSFSIRFADKIVYGSKTPAIDYFAFGQDVGRLIDKRLQEITPSHFYQLLLSGFLVDELSGLSTYILSNSPNSMLKLINSMQQDSLLGNYQSVVTSEYQLQSSLSATQFNQLLQQYFARQNINIQSQYMHTTKQLVVQRTGNPYAPSMVTSFIIFVLVIVFFAGFIRRQMLHLYLQEHTTKRNAQAWLATYKKAAFPVYRLKSKWSSQASYWMRLKRESEEFAKQAKVYYDAGDVNTSKLFISKSLHSDSSNESAKSLSYEIEAYENNTQQLSENEQWIRNKVAKAMNNYRQQQPIKALRRAYQAYERATQVKDLKRQAKAIKKLINKIKAEYVTQARSIMLHCSSDPSSYLICQNQTVHIGRLPNKTDAPWISNQDSVFYINHKSVSRIGQQCQVQRVDDGYCLQDMDSKNGSIVNQQRCEADTLCHLSDGDIIQLGAKSFSSAVRLRVSLSKDNELMQLSFAQQATALLDRRELNKIWPDNTLATRTSLTCVKRSCHLIFDPSLGKMQLMHFNAKDNQSIVDKLSHLETSSRQGTLLAICKISLGSKASIAPIDNNLELLFDLVPLLGEVPLVFPCNLQWVDSSGKVTSFQLNEYDSKAIRYAHSTLLEANI